MLDREEYTNLIQMLKTKKKLVLSKAMLKFIKYNADMEQLKVVVPYLYKRKELKQYFRVMATKCDDIILRGNCSAVFMTPFHMQRLVHEINLELCFQAVVFDFFGDDLCKFVNYRKKYETAYMQGNFEYAKSIINEVQMHFGHSFWGISSMMASASEEHGEIQKIQRKILNECNDALVSSFVKMSGYRFSKDITGKYFQTQMRYIVDEIELENENEIIKEAFKEYIKSMVNPARELDIFSIQELISISVYLPLIDRYCLYEKIFGCLCADIVYTNGNLRSCVIKCAEMINNKLNVPFWDNILVLLKKDGDVNVRHEKKIVHDALSLFCDERFQECYQYCEDKLQLYSDNFSLINLMAKCKKVERSDTPYYEVANFIRKLYMKKSDETEFVELSKVCDIYERFYAHFSFGLNLAVIIETETRPAMLHERKVYVRALIQYDFTPSKLVFFLSEEQKNSFMGKYKEVYNELYFSDWQIATYPEADYKTMSYFKCDKMSLLLSEIKKIEKDRTVKKEEMLNISNNFFVSQVKKYEFENAIVRDSLLEAIEIYISAYFQSQWLVTKMDVKSINEKITISIKSVLECHMSYCIYAMLTRYQLQKGEIVSNTVIKCCENILEKNNVKTPSDLEWPENQLERKKLEFFLRNICTYDVLKRIKTGVNLAQEIYSERIIIIDKLIAYYQQNGETKAIDVLEKEKRNLVTEMECLDIARCINKGKINTRWIVLSDEANEAIIYMYKKYKKNEEDSLSTFIDEFATIKKDYVQEINRILSINIRHGILEGELLRFFKKGGIERKKQNETEKNIDAIERFVQSIYEMLEVLLEHYIVASHKYDGDNKLVLYVEDSELERYFKEMKKINLEEDIKDYYLSILNKTLEKKLPIWGEKICQLINKTVMDNLKLLRDSVDYKMKDEVNKLYDLWGEELEKLKQWFTVTQNQDIKYRLITLGEVIKKEWEYVIIDNKIDKDIVVDGNVINFLFTIIRELIYNAEKYSDKENNEIICPVIIRFFDEEGMLVVQVENTVSYKFPTNKISQDLQDINTIINNAEKYDSKILSRKDIHEGRSGYKKIVKLLERNYDEKYTLKPQFFDENYKFVVTLNIQLEVLI